MVALNSTLRKINGTEMVPLLGHCLMVRKKVPFGALFWCPFAKGHQNGALLVGGTLTKGNCFGAFFTKKGTIFQSGSQRALFWLRLFSQ